MIQKVGDRRLCSFLTFFVTAYVSRSKTTKTRRYEGTKGEVKNMLRSFVASWNCVKSGYLSSYLFP